MSGVDRKIANIILTGWLKNIGSFGQMKERSRRDKNKEAQLCDTLGFLISVSWIRVLLFLVRRVRLGLCGRGSGRLLVLLARRELRF